MLSTIFNWIINNLLQSTPIIIGLVVVIGLVAQKKTFGQIIQGFIKCLIGYQIFVMGIDAFCGVKLYAGYDGPYIRCPGDDAEQRFYKWLW